LLTYSEGTLAFGGGSLMKYQQKEKIKQMRGGAL